jgi:hypothetical protein
MPRKLFKVGARALQRISLEVSKSIHLWLRDSDFSLHEIIIDSSWWIVLFFLRVYPSWYPIGQA